VLDIPTMAIIPSAVSTGIRLNENFFNDNSKIAWYDNNKECQGFEGGPLPTPLSLSYLCRNSLPCLLALQFW